MCTTPARIGLAVLLLVVLVGLAAAQQRPQRGPRLPDGVQAERDIVYLTRDNDRQLKLDLYLPADRAKPLPTLIWIHGGAWRGGSKANVGLPWLLSDGFAIASIEYRLTPEAIWPAQIDDCRAAVRFLRQNAERYGLDPNRFVVAGSSAGGHLAAMIGTSSGAEIAGSKPDPDTSDRVAAVIDLFGPTDFLHMLDQRSHLDHGAPNSPESVLVGGPVRERPEQVRSANPITYIDADDPPFFILHGDADPIVPINQSELLHDALQRAGVPVEFIPLPGARHGGPAFASPEVRAQIRAFLDKHVLVD